MPVAIGLWSFVLTPGEPKTVVPIGDLRISNVAFGELEDTSGRSIVKLHYRSLAAPPADSEDEEEEPEDAAGELQSTVLCALTAGKNENALVDIVLEEEQEYLLELVGKNTVYLTGNYIDQTPQNDLPPYDDESDTSEDEHDLLDVSSDVEVELDGMESDASRFEEVDEPKKSAKRKSASDMMDLDEAKPSKADKKANKKLKAANGEAVPTGAEDKAAKKDKKEKKEAATESKTEQPAKELPGGLKIKDAKVGTGPMAKKGNTISMRYIGKLPGGKVFDKNVKGKPFTFKLGVGEVIKGWDQGVIGMQVGGERLLTVPPALAYGKKGVSGIPPNSTLIFECKLVEIK